MYFSEHNKYATHFVSALWLLGLQKCDRFSPYTNNLGLDFFLLLSVSMILKGANFKKGRFLTPNK